MRTSRPAHGNRPAARLVTAIMAALFLAVLTAARGPAAAGGRGRGALKREPGVPWTRTPRCDISTDQLLDRVDDAGTPIYIAILPTDARAETEQRLSEAGRARSPARSASRAPTW